MPGRSINDPDPSHLRVLEDVRIHEVLYNVRQEPYFEVTWGGEVLRVRVYHGSLEWIGWLKSHLDVPIDLTIFPYKWEIGQKSGVVNFFRSAIETPKIGDPMKRDEIREMLFDTDLSASDEYSVDGPWGHKGLEDLETDAYIFQKGTGAKLKIGKVTVKIGGAMKFEVELPEGVDEASFEVPMRFHVRRQK